MRKIFTAACRRKLALASRRRGAMGRAWHRKYHYWYKGPNGRIAMRSLWEVQYAKALDKAKVKWLYEPITFLLRNERSSWTPDFYLPEQNRFVEIKGWPYPREIQRKLALAIEHFSATRFEIQRHAKHK